MPEEYDALQATAIRCDCIFQSLLALTACRQAEGFILVYGVDSRESFERLERFRQRIVHAKHDRAIFVLVGNKADRKYQRQVSLTEAKSLAESFGCPYIETSAKTAENVQRAFDTLVTLLRQNVSAREAFTPDNSQCCVIS